MPFIIDGENTGGFVLDAVPDEALGVPPKKSSLTALDISQSFLRGLTGGAESIPYYLNKVLGRDVSGYEAGNIGRAAEEAELKEKLKEAPTQFLLAKLISGAGGLTSTLPIDIMSGGISKALLLPRVVPKAAAILKAIPGFGVGMGLRKSLEAASETERPSLDRALRTVGGALQGVTEGSLMGRSMEIGQTLPLLKRLATQVGVQTPIGGVVLPTIEAGKKGELPTLDQMAEGAGMGFAFGLFGGLKGGKAKIDEGVKSFQYERDTFRSEMANTAKEIMGDKVTDAEADYVTRKYEDAALKEAGIKNPTAEDYRRARENMGELKFKMRQQFQQDQGFILESGREGQKALPPGQGFELKGEAYDPVRKILDSMVTKETPLSLPSPSDRGDGFTVRPSPEAILRKAVETPYEVQVEHKPFLTKAGAPYATEAQATRAATKRGLEFFNIVKTEGGYVIQKPSRTITTGRDLIAEMEKPAEKIPAWEMTHDEFLAQPTYKKIRAFPDMANAAVRQHNEIIRQAAERGETIPENVMAEFNATKPAPVSVEPSKPYAPVPSVLPVKPRSIAQNLVTRIKQMGGINLGVDYSDTRKIGKRTHNRELEFPDVKAVSNSKTGLHPDEMAQNLSSEGFDVGSGDDLMELLKSGQARNRYTPEAQDVMLDRWVRRQENEWLERELADLEEKTDPDAIIENQGDIQDGIIDEIRAQGVSVPDEEAALKELEDFFDSVTSKKPTKFSKDTTEIPGFTAAGNFNLAPSEIPEGMGGWKPKQVIPKTAEMPGMGKAVKVEPDAAKRQEIKNSIAEGEMILSSGKSVIGRKMSPEELASVQRSVDKNKAQLGPLPKFEPALSPFKGQQGILNESGKVDISGLVELFKKDRKGFDKVLNPKDMSTFERVFSSPAWLRERYPSMETAFSRQMKRQEDRATILHESLKQNEPAVNLKKNPKAFAKLTKLIWAADGRKFKGVDQARFVWDGDAIKGLNLKHYKEVEAVLKAKNYPQEVIDAFIAIRKDMDRDLIRVYRAMKKMPDIEESTIAEFRKEMGMVQNYFPHHRYGNYYIRGFDKGGNILYREHFDDLLGLNSPGAKLKLVDLRKQYPAVTKWETGKNQNLPEDVYSFPIPVEAMEQIIKAAANRIQDPQLRKTFEEILPKAVSDTMKSRGFGSHMIKRENIPGFVKEDILKVMYDYKAGLAGWLTKMQAANDFSAMLRNIDAKNSPTEWSYVSRYVRDMLQNTDRLDRAVDTVRALVYLKFIAGNVKTGVVNLTQNLISGVPVLSMETKGAGSRWISGAGDDLVGYLTKKKNLKPDEIKLLDELYTEGTNRDNFTQELKGKMTGGLAGLNQTLDVLGLTMSVPERFNRSSLSLAAYRVAEEGKIIRKETLAWLGLKVGEKASYEQAKEFAKRIVERAHFVYGKANLAEPLRGTTMGKIARGLYALQSFTHNLLQLWGYMLRSGGRGYQAFARSMLAQLAIGGMLGIPLIKTFAWAMRKFLGSDPQEEVRKRIPEGPEGNENLYRDMVVYGLPGGAGIDITGSIGIDLPNFKDNPIVGIGGAPYSVFVDAPMRAAEALSSGAPGRAAEAMAPTALANILTAKRMYSEGKKSVSGKILPFPGEAEPQKITKLQAILKGFGFQPTSISNSNEAYRGLKELEAFAKAKQTKFVNRYANAYPDDLKEMMKVTDEVRTWNEKVADAGKPEFVVNLKAVRNRLRPDREPRKFRSRAAERMELYR